LDTHQGKLRVLWINPVGTGEFDDQIKNVLMSVKRHDVEVEVTHLPHGPPNLDYKSYEPLILVETLQIIRRAEKEGFDAVVIGCFDDPGLQEARELVNIPVVGPMEACLHIASTLGHKYSIIVNRREGQARLEDHIYTYGLEKKLASFRSINFMVSEMKSKLGELREAIVRESVNAVEEDRAEVVVLGCTVESGLMEELIDRLKVPVLDAVVVPFKYAEMLADMYRKVGLSHSKVYGYKSPPEGEILI
jgi:allantoin racemase